MYNSKERILDSDLTSLSFNQTVNLEFRLDDLLESDLWVVNDSNGLIKAIPLFNCDQILSSNPNDIILDSNKCIILENNTDSLIQCISSDTGGVHYYNLELYAYTPYTRLDVISELSVYCIVYDEYMNTVNNVDVDVYVDNELVSTVTTDNKGVCKFKIKEPSNIKFKYNLVESNQITIIGE